MTMEPLLLLMKVIVALAGIKPLLSGDSSPTKRPAVVTPEIVVVLFTEPLSDVLALPRVRLSEAALPVTGAEMVIEVPPLEMEATVALAGILALPVHGLSDMAWS